jgi:hypothetical protein
MDTTKGRYIKMKRESSTLLTVGISGRTVGAVLGFLFLLLPLLALTQEPSAIAENGATVVFGVT